MRIYKATRPETAYVPLFSQPEDLMAEPLYATTYTYKFGRRIFLLLPDTLEERISLINFFKQPGYKALNYWVTPCFLFYGSATSDLSKELQDLIHDLGGPTLRPDTLFVLDDSLCRKNGTITYRQDDVNKPFYVHYDGIDYRVTEQIWPTNKTSKKENTNGDA